MQKSGAHDVEYGEKEENMLLKLQKAKRYAPPLLFLASPPFSLLPNEKSNQEYRYQSFPFIKLNKNAFTSPVSSFKDSLFNLLYPPTLSNNLLPPYPAPLTHRPKDAAQIKQLRRRA